MRKALVTTVAPVLSNEEINARLQVALANDPALALALASRVLGGNKVVRNSRATGAVETENERACRCAHFVSGNRRNLLTACIAALGDKNEISLTEEYLSAAVSLPSYRVRADMQTVQDRLNDTGNTAQFPLIAQVGYSLRLANETRGVARSYVFSRVAPVAPAKGKGKAKGKAIAKVAPAPVAPANEGEKSA